MKIFKRFKKEYTLLVEIKFIKEDMWIGWYRDKDKKIDYIGIFPTIIIKVSRIFYNYVFVPKKKENIFD